MSNVKLVDSKSHDMVLQRIKPLNYIMKQVPSMFLTKLEYIHTIQTPSLILKHISVLAQAILSQFNACQPMNQFSSVICPSFDRGKLVHGLW